MNETAVRRYIISAGRTGTVYLERLINETMQDVRAKHEPGGTRYLMMLANIRNDFGLGSRILAKLFERGRARRERDFGPYYVEINPFLCAFADLLPAAAAELRVVHIIRDPADWARSIYAFKASTRFRSIIDYLPFAKPYPSPRPPGWRSLNGYEKALWRWNWCNEKIACIEKRCFSFTVIRYEDLFSSQKEVRNRQLSKIRLTLGLPNKTTASQKEILSRENAFSASNMFVDQDAARRICGRLARNYGYDY